MSMDVGASLTWLDEFAQALPALPARRKTLFDIMGNGASELTMSALLAFYLDQHEEHGFGDLFLRSLLDALEEKGLLADEVWRSVRADAMDFEVVQEWATKGRNKKYIDLVITGPAREGGDGYAWAILIEHKINAAVYNRLDIYAEAVTADPKVCVVLAPVAHVVNEPGWHPLTHAELLHHVKRNLATALPGADDRHLLFLRDFLSNLDTTMKQNEDLAHRHRMTVLNSYADRVEELTRLRDQLQRHFIAALDAAMLQRGFKQEQSTANTITRMYYAVPKKYHAQDAVAWAFRIWVPVHQIVDKGTFVLNFELNEPKNTVHGGAVKNALRLAGWFATPQMTEGVGGAEGQAFCHIAVVKAPLDKALTIRQGIEAVLDTTLFRDQGRLIHEAITALVTAQAAKQE
ncbi:MAG: PD-(D/E)XK nuclease family protein [Flavobacteriales bacterium]|nr:MAG: PD-(D/E)XK nuclease family protein [Flavobacteriales bacterium]